MFDSSGRQTRVVDLPESSDDVWHGFLPDCHAGQHYGYRVHGPFAPARGLRCNPAKLLIDPYARALSGQFDWHESSFDSNDLDSAQHVPKSVVCDPSGALFASRPRVAWSEMVFYEANVRGFTMRHPDVPEADRGKFAGMRNSRVLEYLKALGHYVAGTDAGTRVHRRASFAQARPAQFLGIQHGVVFRAQFTLRRSRRTRRIRGYGADRPRCRHRSYS